MGVDVKDAVKVDACRRPTARSSRRMLFSKIVPNCKKLGLLDAGDGWLRERFTELGVIQFEDWVDTGEEYASSTRSPRTARPQPSPAVTRRPASARSRLIEPRRRAASARPSRRSRRWRDAADGRARRRVVGRDAARRATSHAGTPTDAVGGDCDRDRPFVASDATADRRRRSHSSCAVTSRRRRIARRSAACNAVRVDAVPALAIGARRRGRHRARIERSPRRWRSTIPGSPGDGCCVRRDARLRGRDAPRHRRRLSPDSDAATACAFPTAPTAAGSQRWSTQKGPPDAVGSTHSPPGIHRSRRATPTEAIRTSRRR